jgi:hypothetical protein
MTDVVDTERLRKWLVNTSEEHGAAVMHVAGDDDNASYAFSVGAWRRFGKPEAVVIGLPKEVAHAVINTYVQRVGGGERFSPGRLYEGFVAEAAVTVEKVAMQHYPEYLGSAMLVYGDPDFPAVQLLLPTAEGAFPWHDDAPPGFAEFQPVLTTSGRPESWTPGHDGA